MKTNYFYFSIGEDITITYIYILGYIKLIRLSLCNNNNNNENISTNVTSLVFYYLFFYEVQTFKNNNITKGNQRQQ